MKPLHLASLAALCINLAACGGSDGSSSIASAPPPAASPTSTPSPTPTAAANPFTLPPTPATTSGTYQAFSTVQSYSDLTSGEFVTPQAIAPAGAVTLTVDAASKTYALSVNAGTYSFPARQMTMAATADLGIARNNPRSGGTPDQFTPQAQIARGDLLAVAVPNGSDVNGAFKALGSVLTLYNVGQMDGSPRYVSAAYWAQFNMVNTTGVDTAANYRTTEGNNGYMVFGPRTAGSDLPVSGKATFALDGMPADYQFQPACDSAGGCGAPPTVALLAVDFATRQLDASIRHAETFSLYNETGEVEVARGDIAWLVSGSSQIGANGGFDISLSGNGTVHTARTDGTFVADITRSIGSTMTGAFFGPQAAEVGGLWALPQLASNGTVFQSVLLPFVGLRTGP